MFEKLYLLRHVNNITKKLVIDNIIMYVQYYKTNYNDNTI